MLLLSSGYRDGKVRLKWYDEETKKIVITGGRYKTFCYTKEKPDIPGVSSEQVERFDLLMDEKTQMWKNTAEKHDAFGFDGNKLNMNAWEVEYRGDELYLRDNHLICGLEDGGRNNEAVVNSLSLEKPTKESYVREWKNTLSERIPDIPRIAVDIETENSGVVPDTTIVREKVTCIGIAGDVNAVLILDEKGLLRRQVLQDYALIPFKSEAKMIAAAFNYMENRMVITFNGDQFDMPYLRHRLERLTDKKVDPMMVHIDLYMIYSTPAFKIYVYPRKYIKDSLNAVSEGILGKKKIEYDVLKKVETEQDLMDVAKYCYHDSALTYELTTTDDNLLIKILIIFSRMCRIPMERIGRSAVGNWTKSMLYHEHARYNYIIPSRKELNIRSKGVINESIGKKYKGAMVFKPKPGVHFDVTVLDFASLYPSIVKTNNISYETVRCVHEECKSNKIPMTNHWACTINDGLEKLLVGTLRDMRVDHFKKMKDHTNQIITGALKVFLNASYGVMGADTFSLYFLPAAESTTALGRHIILGSIEKAESLGVEVLYGDSVLGTTPIICEYDGEIFIMPISLLFKEEPEIFKNTFAQTCKDKELTVSQVIGLMKYSALQNESLPENVREAVSKEMDKRMNGERKSHEDLKILSDDGLVNVNYSYKHYVKKTGYHVGTCTGYVQVTDDHSFVINGKEIKPSELNMGDKLDLMPVTKIFKNNNGSFLDRAWLCGFLLNLDNDLQDDEKIEEKLKREMELISGKNMDELSDEEQDDVMMKLSDEMNAICGDMDSRIIPACILNGTIQVKEAFINGIIDAGMYEKDGIKIMLNSNQTVIAGITSILGELNRTYSLMFEGKEPHIYLCFDKQSDDGIIYLEKFEINEPVYDISTSNEHFRGGIGNVLLHNTDSVFIWKITDDQIQEMINSAKERDGVDLEVDKKYRYVALSDRKKNYFGVFDDGSLDVKGLSGKKSNTPQFVKNLSSDILEILKMVENEEEFVEAKKKVYGKIERCFEYLNKKEIPIEELAVMVKITKPIENYGKESKEKPLKTETLPGMAKSASRVMQKRGLPQHVKAANLMKEPPQVGEFVKFVKTSNNLGVMMVEDAKADDIDIKKYIEIAKNTLEQIIDPLEIKMPISRPAGQTTLF